MIYTTWPRSNVQVSRLGFGGMGLCNCFELQDQKSMVRSVLHSLERGINFIDTARGYGESEALIGQALKEWSGPRPFVATKVESLGKDNTRWVLPPKLEETFPKGHVRKNAETSLRLLGVDRIDLLQLHLYWPTWGASGYWMEELQALRAEGKVAAIGVSAPDHRHDVVLPLVLSGLIDSVQTIINIFDPLALDALVPLCNERGVAVLARCVLDEGGLAGTLSADTEFRDGDFRNRYFDAGPRSEYLRRLDALRAFVPKHARNLASLALKFVLSQPGVTTALSSMHITAHADANINALEEPALSQEVFEDLRRRHRWVRNLYEEKYWT